MIFKNTLFVVKDMVKSIDFYRNVVGLDIVSDFGSYKVLTGGLALQTYDSWRKLTKLTDDLLLFKHNTSEIYFEEESYDEYVKSLNFRPLKFINLVAEQPSGQRAVRFYDPDGNIIEVGETISCAIVRLSQNGMSLEDIALKTSASPAFIKKCLK